MKIVFIGAGNVATNLATQLYNQSCNIAQIYSRTIESAENLAKKVNASYTNDINLVITNADLYIFSVKDSILEDLLSRLPANKGIWIHTAGSISINIFEKYSLRYGVIYPFQTFSKNIKADWKNIPVFIEASDNDTLKEIRDIACSLSDNVRELSSENRKYIHLTGVFACNFTNYMYTLSAEILKKIGLEFDITLPLIDETCNKVHILSPFEAQTGPAIRFDENVITKHLQLIDDEKTREIYRLISEGIYEIHKNKNL